ncbi:DNA primase, partial [Nitratireductor sp. GCM10026969]
GERGGYAGRPQGRPGAASGRLAVSESLARSSLLKFGGGMMPLREASIMVALVNHPALLDPYFDAVDHLHLESPDLLRLRSAILDAVASGLAQERQTLIDAIAASGAGDVLDRAEALVRRANHWPALPEAAFEDAREAFLQALHLHRSAAFLHKELKAAEQALAEEPTDGNYRHLVEIQAELRNVQATEALIEGFGLLSGRTDRS